MLETITKISKNKGNVSVKDANGHIFVVNVNDPRYINKELVSMNKGRIHLKLRGKFCAKNKEGQTFMIDKNDERYKNGELVCVTKKNKPPKEKPPKIYKERKKVDINGRTNMSDSQKEYQINRRSNKYPKFKYKILSKDRGYLVKDFCIHGDLIISAGDFNLIYNEYDNNLNLYCDKCKDVYIDNLKISNEDINNSRNKLSELYKYPTKLKENYIKLRHVILYRCILNNNRDNISWQEKLFLFKEGLSERPKCLFDKCNNDTFFSPSNQRYTNFCQKHLSGFTSKGEIEVFNYISKFYPNVKKLRLKGNEFDIYISELNIAFEFNGLYWHNFYHKGKKYHYDKWKFCQDNDIQLMNIWEDDWYFKQDIVKSIILNKLGKNNIKIYARQCIIKNVNNEECNKFLEENHLQGKCSSSINLGLFYDNELVSLMTFGKRKISNKLQFELLRFCSKLNTNVIGAASKLFKHFINNYSFDKVVSYASCDISNGDLYEQLDFKKCGHTGINYWWSNNVNKYHRSKFMKYRIKDENNKDKTGNEIMTERGFNKIFGTGNLKYEYINKS